MKKTFTLIEIIVVVVILAILTSIVIPNIKDTTHTASKTAILNNTKSLQTAVDMYKINYEGQLPTLDTPTLFIPVQLDFSKLEGEFVRSLPKTKEAKYWLDYNGTVWGSTVNPPSDIKNENGNISWRPVEGAKEYLVFEVLNFSNEAGNVSNSKVFFKLVAKITTNSYQGIEGKAYVVSAIDEEGFQTPPSGVEYVPFANHSPIVFIQNNLTENETMYSNAFITWNYSSSYDPDGDLISGSEWKVDGTLTDNPNGTLTAGSHIIALRLQDSKGLWSEWKEKQITIVQYNTPPKAVIGMIPDSNSYTIYANTNIQWQYNQSTDAENNEIIEAEWKIDGVIKSDPNGFLSTGNHTVELRVKDSLNAWSTVVSKSFNVTSAFITKTLNYTGNAQTFVIPVTGTYKLEVWGAEGGSYTTLHGGGNGGYSSGEKLFNVGDVINVYVGGKGSTDGRAIGGYNGGGGHGGTGSNTIGGGGATDVRFGGNALENRIIVAGGGGGSAWCYDGSSQPGNGGGLVGSDATSANSQATAAKGGTQTSGGIAGTFTDIPAYAGTLGKGGAAITSNAGCGGAGAGGGGYYGGGGGNHASAGGGGSSYIGGVQNGTTTSGVREDNGMFILTLLR